MNSVVLATLCAVSVVLILLSMIFSATESAFLAVNKLRVRLLKNKRDKRAARGWKLLSSKDRLINTLLVANNIVNIALSAIFTMIAVELFGSAGVGVATFVVTILLLIFGEISPKTVATHHPEAIAFFFSRFVEILEVVLSPVVFVFARLSKAILRLLRVNFQSKRVSYTEEEIKTFLDVGHEQGVLEASEKSMMAQVFKFTDLEAKAIMIPRKQIKAIPLGTSYTKIVEMAQRLNLSRFPVYKKDIDDIVGILYIKDMMAFKNSPQEFTVDKVMRAPLFVLGTKKMSGVQQMLRESKQSMAVVVDEYSGTYGILTREDIVREIFGPVTDGKKIYAHKVELPLLDLEHGPATVDGLVRLLDLNEQLSINLQSKDSETLGGFILETLGAIPAEGACIRDQGFAFSVERVEDNRIKRVRIKRLDSSRGSSSYSAQGDRTTGSQSGAEGK